MPHADGSSAWGIFYACSLFLWQNIFDFSVWTWDNVYAEQFANALRSSSTSVSLECRIRSAKATLRSSS